MVLQRVGHKWLSLSLSGCAKCFFKNGFEGRQSSRRKISTFHFFHWVFSKLFKSGSKCFSWHKNFLKFPIKNLLFWDFPGGPVVKILCFQCRRCRFNAWHLSSGICWLRPPTCYRPVFLFSMASTASWITLISFPFLITLHACRHQLCFCVQPPVQISSLHTPALYSSLLHQIYPRSRLGLTQHPSCQGHGCLSNSLRWELESCLTLSR